MDSGLAEMSEALDAHLEPVWQPLFRSLVLNVSISVLGASWWIWSSHTSKSRRASAPDESGAAAALLGKQQHLAAASAAADNYLTYLRVCACMFLTLALVKAVLLLPSPGSLAVAVVSGENLVELYVRGGHGGSVGPALAWIVTCVIDGCIALLFVELIEALDQPIVPDEHTRERMQRTIWLTMLPRKDLHTNKIFELGDDELDQVRKDLVKAIDNQTSSNRAASGESVVEECQVALVLDSWHQAQTELRLTEEYISARESSLSRLATRSSSMPFLAVWEAYLRFRVGQLVARRDVLEAQCLSFGTGKRQLSGSAFVTLRTAEQCTSFLQEAAVNCWRLRNYSFFSFGRPPFASVTLLCKRAPVPDDIDWCNLHIGFHRRCLVLSLCSLLLFLLMLALVTPTSLVVLSGALIDQLSGSIVHIEHALDLKNTTKEELESTIDRLSSGLWSSIVSQIPTMVLLLINSCVLPTAIEAIGNLERCYRKSTFEEHQKLLNHIFLLLNTVLFPFIGATTLAGAAQRAPRKLHVVVGHMQRILVSRSVGQYGLKYLMSAAFLSSTIALLDVSQVLAKSISRRLVLTQRERLELRIPWPFAWGYWYAWTLSIFFMSLLMGGCIPAMHLMAAAFFCLRYLVDRYNLKNQVFVCATDAEGSLALTAIRDMKVAVGFCWLVLGALAMLSKRLFAALSWPLSDMEAIVLMSIGALLLVAGAAVTGRAHMMFRRQMHSVRFRGVAATTSKPPVLCLAARMVGAEGALVTLLGIKQRPPKVSVPDANANTELPENLAEVHWDGARFLGVVRSTMDSPVPV